MGLILAAALGAAVCGCTLPLGPWGGPAYELDTRKIGTGEPAIAPRNDEDFWNGEPMDYRRR